MTTNAKEIDKGLLAKIDTLQLSDQAKRLREIYFETSFRIASERARVAMDAWKETEGQPIARRRAHLFERVLQEVPIVIHPYERTAGSETRWFRGVHPSVDVDSDQLLMQLSKGKMNLMSSAHYGAVAEEDWPVLLEAARYFNGKTGTDLVRELRRQALGTWWDDFMEVRGTTIFEHGHIQAGVPQWEKVLARGLDSFLREAEQRVARFATLDEDDPEKLLFWQASITCCQAVIAYAEKYATLAERMAANERDYERKRQLEQIAKACRWVPANPARSFFEALQSIRLVHVALKLEGTFPASIGRLDQYLYPYFMADLAAGRLTLSEAVDLIADLISYISRNNIVMSIEEAQFAGASSAIINVTLAGVTRDGKDACNELTYLVLHVAGLVRYAQPQITFRLNHRLTPRNMLLKAFQTNCRVGGGIPQFHNDEHNTQYLLARGTSLEDARDWATHGCSMTVSPKNCTGIRSGNWPNMALALDLALHNGIASRTGKRIGLETGDPRNFASFDDLCAAVRNQIEFVVRRSSWNWRFGIRAWAQRYRVPFTSTLLTGCLENGRDMMQGGQADHSLLYTTDRGFINVGDSLAAIKKLVFEEKQLTLSELLEAVDSDFVGERGEAVRRLCLGAPKFGNDDPEPDGIVRDLAKFSASVILSKPNAFGQPYAINRDGVGWHYYASKGVGALPDGKKKEELLADGSLSPMRGLDRHGPTAVLQSALRADFREATSAILNLRFPQALFQGPEASGKLAALTETFFQNGGTHVQFNLLDHKTLLEAQKHPERYRDLVVRVAGYSALFIHLPPEVQNDIIQRTDEAL